MGKADVIYGTDLRNVDDMAKWEVTPIFLSTDTISEPSTIRVESQLAKNRVLLTTKPKQNAPKLF